MSIECEPAAAAHPADPTTIVLAARKRKRRFVIACSFRVRSSFGAIVPL